MGSGISDVLLVMGTQRMEDEGCRLPGSAHDEDPAIRLPEGEGLEDVRHEENAKEDCNGNSRGILRAEIVVGIAGVDGNVAMFARYGGGAASSEDILR